MEETLCAWTAEGRSAEIAQTADVYGWLVGSWDLEVVRHGEEHGALRAEAHFAWVLEGRAVQDVWIMPPRPERTATPGRQHNLFGTTLRVFDQSIQAWRVTWINPVNGARDELIGRRVGDEIVQVGRHADGTPIRWVFTDISDRAFRWKGEALEADGRTWKLEAEFRARRRDR